MLGFYNIYDGQRLSWQGGDTLMLGEIEIQRWPWSVYPHSSGYAEGSALKTNYFLNRPGDPHRATRVDMTARAVTALRAHRVTADAV